MWLNDVKLLPYGQKLWQGIYLDGLAVLRAIDDFSYFMICLPVKIDNDPGCLKQTPCYIAVAMYVAM